MGGSFLTVWPMSKRSLGVQMKARYSSKVRPPALGAGIQIPDASLARVVGLFLTAWMCCPLLEGHGAWNSKSAWAIRLLLKGS